MPTARLSTKGQLILPKDIRTARAWGPGTEFTIECDRVLLAIPRGVLERLRRYKTASGVATWAQAIDALLLEREGRR